MDDNKKTNEQVQQEEISYEQTFDKLRSFIIKSKQEEQAKAKEEQAKAQEEQIKVQEKTK